MGSKLISWLAFSFPSSCCLLLVAPAGCSSKETALKGTRDKQPAKVQLPKGGVWGENGQRGSESVTMLSFPEFILPG